MISNTVNREEYIKEEHEKTLKEAQKAIELYRSGATTEEVAGKMNVSVITIKRYYKRLGGITPKDKALHMQGRYLK